MMELIFNDPKHRKGLNMTVRLGVKWLGEIQAHVQGLGVRDIRTMAMRFDDVDDAVIQQFIHTDSIEDRLDLVSALIKAYGGRIEPHDIVTLVFYDREGGTPK